MTRQPRAKATPAGRGGREQTNHIVYHSLADAREALEAAIELGVSVTLRTAPGAVGYAGAAYLKKIVDIAREEVAEARITAMLDCGDNGAAALNAIRAGWRAIVFRGRPAVRARVQAVAKRRGVTCLDCPPPALNLVKCVDPATACREWLSAHGSRPLQRADARS